ncbi:MAG: sigma-70 family RNA polymerase sigma factor [Bacillota bacterium]
MKQSDNVNSKDKEIALLKLAQTGDQHALESLILQYKGLVLRVVRNYFMVCGGDRDDIIQEGTIGLLKAITSYREESGASFSTHAYNCVNNSIKDALRKVSSLNNMILNEAIRHAETTTSSAEQSFAVDDIDAITMYGENEKREEFYAILSTLITAPQMEVVRLYIEGYSYKDIAEKTNKTTKNIDNIITSTKSKIKKAEAKFAKLRGE